MGNVIDEHIGLLGWELRDRVTGFSGVVSSVSFDLYGCLQALLTPPVDNEGKPVEPRWFDTNRLEMVVPNKRVMEPPEFGAESPVWGPAEKPAK